MAMNTSKTYLYFGTSSSSLTKLCDIKNYPDMIGDPELLESTTLSDLAQTYVPGIKGQDILQFTANYDDDEWDNLAANENTDGYFELRFGGSPGGTSDTTGADGKFQWQGQYTLGLPGGDVNAVREMTINVIPSTAITKAA